MTSSQSSEQHYSSEQIYTGGAVARTWFDRSFASDASFTKFSADIVSFCSPATAASQCFV